MTVLYKKGKTIKYFFKTLTNSIQNFKSITMDYSTHSKPSAAGSTNGTTMKTEGRLRLLHVYMKAAFLFLILGATSLTKSYAALTITVTTPTAVPAANVCQYASNVPIYRFTLTGSAGTSNPNFQGLTFTRGGTSVTGDIVQYKLWSGSIGGTLLATSTTPSFTGFSVGYSSGTTNNYFITADIAGTAVVTHTIIVSALTAGDVNMSGFSTTVTTSGPPVAGGAQTIISGVGLTGPSTPCVGSTITLTPTVTGGAWATGSAGVATVSGGTVGGVSAGTSTISYTLGSCTATQVETVSAVTAPSVTISQTPSGAQCSGTNIRFNSSVTNGGSSPTYQWYVNGTMVSTVTNYQTNSYSNGNLVYVVVTSSLPCSSPTTATSATATVTINPTPVITGPSTVCVGSTVTLSATPAGGVWTSSNTSRATVGSSSGIVTGVSSSGGTNMTYTLGGCSNSQSMTVSNTTTPVVTLTPVNGTSICSGASASFFASSSGGGGSPAYQWLVNSVPASTATLFSTSTLANGDVVKLVLTTSAVCTTAPTDTGTVTMTVNPTPAYTTTFGSACTGVPGTFVATPSGGVWSSSNSGIATVTGGIVTGLSGGTSTISYTLAGCSTTSTVTMNASPSPFTITPSSAAICSLGVQTLTANDPAPGGVTTPPFVSTAAFTVPDGVNSGITNSIFVSGIPADAAIADVSVVLNSISMTYDADLIINIGAPNGKILNLVNQRGNDGDNFTNTVISSLGGAPFTNLTASAPFTGTYTADAQNNAGPTTLRSNTTSWAALFSTANGNWTLGVRDQSTPDIATVNSWSIIIHYTTPAGSYTWSSTTGLYTNSGLTTAYTGGAATTVYASPASTITYTATKSETGLTCTSSSSAAVTVNPLPSISATAAPNPVCVGRTVSLNATPSGGSGTYSSYSWSGPGSFTATTQNTTDAGLTTAGVNVYTATVTDSKGCTATTTASVTVGAAPTITATATPGTVCSGATLTLNATPAGGSGTYPAFIWSGPGGYTASTQTATNPGMSVTGIGVYTVTVTDGNGCTSTPATTAPVALNVSPTISASATPTALCAGGTVTLNATPVAGGSTTFSSFSWSGPAGFTSTVQNTTNAGVTASGIYSVTVTDGNGCTSAAGTTLTVTVNPLPVITATATPTAICAGTTLTLNSTPAGGSGIYTSYSWNGPGSFSTTGQNVTRPSGTGARAGIYSVTVTDNKGCTSASGATLAVTVNALPTITATATPNPICAGNTLTLNATPAGGGGTYPTFSWSGPSGFSTTGQTATITGISGTAAGIYSVTVTDINGCTSANGVTTTVTVNALPSITATATPAAICAGNTLSLNATPSGGSTVYSSYSWSGPGSFTATTQNTTNASISGAGAGVYSVTVTDNNGCTSAPGNTLPVVVNALPDVTSFSLPSATSGCLGISSVVTANSSSLGSGTFNVTYNLTGANVVTGHTASIVIAAGTGSFTIPSTDLTNPGSTTVTVTSVINGFGCNSNLSTGNTASFTINPLPAAITGAASVCLLSTTTLSDASTGGTWASADAAIASVDAATGVVYGVAVGSTTVTYTLPTSCFTTQTVLVNPIPNIYSVTGGGSFCTSNPTIHVGLSGSDLGASYQLYRGGVPTGGLVTGTGSSLDLGLQTVSGNYSIVANPSATCAVGMTGTVNIAANPSPTVYPVTGGGGYCFGGTGVAIGLGNSQSGVSYQLFNGGASGLPITGSGPAISFGSRTAAGTYTVIATNASSLCTSNMSGSASVVINPVPPAITGTPTVCTGFTTTLSDALTGGTWSSSSLLATVDPTTGVVTGYLASTPNIIYTIAGCSATLQITVNTSPLPIGGSAFVCQGSTTSLSDGTTGGTWSSSNTGIATVSATGSVSSLAAGNTNITYVLPTGCSTTVVVTVNSQPAAITGATILCSGVPSPLSDATSGGTWSSSNTFIASVNPSTGTVLGSGIGTANITYTLAGGCRSNTTVTVNTSGATSGPGAVCPGSTITLTNVATGGTWSSSATAIATVGGGSGVVSGVSAGTVSIIYTTTTGCTSPVFNVTVNSLPALKTVTGGGNYCLGGAGNHIGLSGSDAGISYQLFNGATPVGAALAGTGSVLDFGSLTTSGTYTVVATNTATGCTRTMTGSATITINPLPAVFAVSGGGNYCSGGAGVHVTLSGSVAGIGYQLYDASVPMGASVSGTGLSIDFGFQTSGGSYGVVATNPTTGCYSVMSGSAFVNVLPLPTAYAVTGGGSYCAGGAGLNVFLTSSVVGTDYQLFNGTIPVGAPVHGTNAALNFGPQTTAGTYTVVGTNTVTGCTGPMAGNATITINPLPTPNIVTGGGGYCFGTASTLPVGLNSSVIGNSYQLLLSGSPLGSPLAGTGSALNFGVQSTAGTYTVRATTVATGCNAIMSGSAIISINSLPTVFAVTGGGSYCPGPATVHVGLAGSVSGVNYQLYSSGTPTGSPVAGTGAALDFGAFAAGSYTVVATSGVGCTSNMTGSASITTSAVPSAFNVGGGGSYCAGGSAPHVTLGGSVIGTTYQLLNGASIVGSLAGTGASLDFGAQTAAGTYTVKATNAITGCTATMTGSVNITINPLPISTYAVTGGGSYCAGGAGKIVGLSNSTSGVSYQLFVDGIATGSAVSGTGSSFNFPLQTAVGSYTVIGTSGASCASNMTGSVSVSTTPLPVVYNVTGGGGYCSGTTTGVHIGLASSNVGINYQLFIGGTTPVGAPVAGIGGALDFGVITTLGNYTVVATNTSTLCTSNMFGSAVVSTNLPPVAYTLSGGGNYCSGGAGLPLSISNSDAGVNYQLLRGGVPTGSPLAGTGSSLSFGNQTVAGSYAVVATHGTTGCTNNMTGVAAISINPLPAIFAVTSDATTYCAGGTGVHVRLGGSVVGFSYQLYNAGATVGSSVPGTGAALDFGVQGAGVYTVVATNNATSCTNQMSGTIVVSTTPLPTAYNVTGGGNYCAGSTGVDVGLSSSNTGISYQLSNGVSPVGTPVTGTGAAIHFGLQTAGTYTVIATNATTGCTQIMTGSATVGINALPVAQAVLGGGNYCAGGTGVDVSLSGSNTGITYRLFNGTTPVGVAMTGTGAGIDFGMQTVAGHYTVVATNTATTCTNTMTGSATVGISPLPNIYSVTGGGNYCPAGTGVAVGLSGSDLGVNYQLYNGVVATGGLVAGTGSAITFGSQTGTGTYTVVAINATTPCTSDMSGSATIGLNSLPLPYNVGGGGNFCTGGTGVHVTLDGSETGNTYQLYKGVTPVGAVFAGTGFAIDFGLQTAAGTYSVKAANTATTCANDMAGNADVAIDALPTAYPIAGGGNYCVGTGGMHINLTASDGGISYQLYNGISPVGAPIFGSGSSIDFGAQTTPGTYTIAAYNTVTTCNNNMSGSVTISINTPPTVYSVTGGGNYCIGGTGVHVNLSGSTTGISYQLYNGAPVGAAVTGTGSSLDFGIQSATGAYTVVATNTATSCTSIMSGSASVGINALPVAYTVSSSASQYCAGGTGVSLLLSNSEAGVNYQLYAGPVPAGLAVPGTGLGLNLGLQTIGATYTVVATNATTGCVNNMAGSATITVNPLPVVYMVTGGGNYCNGGDGVHVGLSSSHVGTLYQLYNGIAPVGSTLTGTGAALDFGSQTAAGTYKVIATDPTTTCVNTMAGSATVAINSLPVTFTVTGGGNYCAAGVGVHVGLSGSASGITYQLNNGAGGIGSPVPGTGTPIDFGAQTLAGGYTVVATNTATGCSSNMFGSAPVIINALPASYTVTGSGGYCAGGTGLHIGLLGSDAGISYQLFNSIGAVSLFSAGTGGAVDFGSYTAAGSYTVMATNTATGCSTTMPGSATIVVNPLPSVYTVTGGGNYCAGGTGVHIGLSNSGSGISYQLLNGGVPAALPVSGTGVAVDFGLSSAVGTYAVVATNSTTGCTAIMTGTAAVAVSPLVTPAVSISAGDDTVCAGTSVSIHAVTANAGSTPTYSWTVNGLLVAETSGTLTYSPAVGDVVGLTMTSSATCATPAATSTMLPMMVLPHGMPTMTITSTPGDVVCQGTSVTYTAATTFGGTAPTYSWMVNGTAHGTGATLTYTPVNGDVVYGIMNSNYQCRLATAVASNNVNMEVDVPVTPTVTVAANPGTNVNPGQVVSLTSLITNTVIAPTYQWLLNGQPIAGATNSSYTVSVFSNADSFTCVVTSGGGCGGLKGANSVVMHSGVGVHQVASAGSDVKLVPNPNKGTFTVKGSLGTTSDEEVTLEVTDMIGRVIYNEKVMAHGGNIDQRIQLSNTLANGMYILNLRSESTNDVFHVVIEQ